MEEIHPKMEFEGKDLFPSLAGKELCLELSTRKP